MCYVVLTVYHDSDVFYYGRPMVNKKNKNLVRVKFHNIKIRLLQFATDVTEWKKINICILTQATTTIKCAFLRDTSNIINIIRQHKPVS